jgi:hypothetical protein
MVELAAMPLAARGARRSFWWLQAGLALALAIVMATVASRMLFGGGVTWWRCFVVYLISVVGPTIVASWSGRAAVRRWPRIPRTSAAIGTLAGLSLAIAASVIVTMGMLPDFINARM